MLLQARKDAWRKHKKKFFLMMQSASMRTIWDFFRDSDFFKISSILIFTNRFWTVVIFPDSVQCHKVSFCQQWLLALLKFDTTNAVMTFFNTCIFYHIWYVLFVFLSIWMLWMWISVYGLWEGIGVKPGPLNIGRLCYKVSGSTSFEQHEHKLISLWSKSLFRF